MDPLEQLAQAALQRDSLRLRSLVQDLTRAGKVNWLGTYQHAAKVWQKGSEYKKN